MISTLDYSVVGAYLAVIVFVAFLAGRRQRTSKDGDTTYFLAGRSLGWPVIGLSMFAANISTVHLVSLSEAAYKSGLVYGAFEWMAASALIVLSIIFAPKLWNSGVATLPDFLERRFNSACRDALSVTSILSAIVLHMGVTLYTAAIVLLGLLGLPADERIFGMNALFVIIAALGAITGAYTLWGGLLAVVWTETVQTVLLLLGAAVITASAYLMIGGFEPLRAILESNQHPLAGQPGIPEETSNFLSILRGPNDSSGMPWYAMLLGYPVIGIWYWCCDQTVAQRVLAAKDVRAAQLGPLFCAALKILPVFLFVLPGVMLVALVQSDAFKGEAPTTAADSYVFMITHLLPDGLRGLLIAALLAAAMQSCSAALNSTATLIAFDVVKRRKPNISNRALETVGRWATAGAAILGVFVSPIFGQYDTIFQGLNLLISYVAAPITTVFLFGLLWKRASAIAAVGSMLVGGLAGGVVFLADLFGYYRGNFMINAFALFCLCSLLMVALSLRFPNLNQASMSFVWNKPSAPITEAGPLRSLFDARLMSLMVAGVFILLFFTFR
jgi:solute:Na+ symporter, SSS family